MPRILTKNAEDIVKAFLKIGFYIKSQKGSHIKICRIVNLESQILIIPNHKEMKNGTLNSIYKKSRDYISEQELQDIFF
jgi:predicted RNA binding protein YcfA (HicA-like mRNA interferase family)